jgi:hypothetical protein
VNVAERAGKLSRLEAIEDLNGFGMPFETMRIDLPDAGKGAFVGPVRMNRNYLIALFVLYGLLVITSGSVRTTEATQSFAPRSLYAVN